MANRVNPLVGKTIVGVYLATDGQAIRFDIEGDPVPARPGTRLSIVARADGDCCSRTWIEALDNPRALLGVVQAVEDIDMPDRGQPAEDWEAIKYYGCRITTDRGICVIDYRNSSNGYYGGILVWPGDEYFYGGVFDQNVSTQEWKNLA